MQSCANELCLPACTNIPCKITHLSVVNLYPALHVNDWAFEDVPCIQNQDAVTCYQSKLGFWTLDKCLYLCWHQMQNECVFTETVNLMRKKHWILCQCTLFSIVKRIKKLSRSVFQSVQFFGIRVVQMDYIKEGNYGTLATAHTAPVSIMNIFIYHSSFLRL